MKKAKFMVACASFILITLLCSELYQEYLRSFTGAFYYIGISYKLDRQEVCECVEQAAVEEELGVFACRTTELGVNRSVLDIYATDKMKTLLSEKYGVIEGEKRSFLSGTTTVVFWNLSDIPSDSNLENYYFSGDMSQVLRAKAKINATFPSSYVHEDGITQLHRIPTAVFCVFALLILVFTWIDIQFQRKKNFILLSMGQSVTRIMLTNIGLDTVVFLLIFFGTRLIFGKFFYIGYEKEQLFFCLLVFLVLNSCLYFSILKLNYKEVLYGANINGKLLSSCYVIKAVSLIITIVCLAINIGLISENHRYLEMYDSIDQYHAYSFVKVTADVSDTENFIESIQKEQKVISHFVLDYMRQGKVALSGSSFSMGDSEKEIPILHVNENTYGISEILNGISLNETVDFYLFIPSAYKDSPEFKGREESLVRSALGCLSENIRISSSYYDGDFSLVWFNYQSDVSKDGGFEKEDNPVLLYWNHIPDGDITFGCFSGAMQENIMFRMTEKEYNALKKTYENLHVISKVGVTERCGQYRLSFSRLLILGCVIGFFMFLWEVLNLYMIVKLEYQINAKLLAVQKILGYSLFQKSKAVLLVNLYAALISISTVCVCCVMFKISGWYTVAISSIILFLIETIFLFFFIIKTEKSSVPGILKGGSL